MLKNLFVATLTLFTCLASANAQGTPQYKIIDLGTLETDASEALAINDKGQVLGVYHDRGCSYTFLWEEATGLTTIDCPATTEEPCWPYPYHFHSAKLNNSGMFCCSLSPEVSFLWSPESGTTMIEHPEASNIGIQALNDKGELAGIFFDEKSKNKQRLFYWHKGKFKDLTETFIRQTGLTPDNFNVITINNLGHIAIVAREHKSYKEKSWIFRSGLFRPVMQEEADDARITNLDDEGNMIISFENGQKFCFIKPSKGLRANFHEWAGCHLLRNGNPVRYDCLPGKLKNDVYGNFYIAHGVEIKKLLIEEAPFFQAAHTAEIRDQNSKGWVVGIVDTVHSGRHAFLAIPQSQ